MVELVASSGLLLLRFDFSPGTAKKLVSLRQPQHRMLFKDSISFFAVAVGFIKSQKDLLGFVLIYLEDLAHSLIANMFAGNGIKCYGGKGRKLQKGDIEKGHCPSKRTRS